MLSRLLSGAAPTVGGAFVVTLAATICGLALGILRIHAWPALGGA